MAEAGKATRVEINLERLAKALGEYSSILERVSEDLGDLKAEIDSYLSGADKHQSTKRHIGKQYSSKQSKRGRDKYTFNKAILAVLHKHGCLSQVNLWKELDPKNEYEDKELENAFKYLADKGVIQFDMVQGCWFIKG